MLEFAERVLFMEILVIMLICCGLLPEDAETTPPGLEVLLPPIIGLVPIEKLLRRPEKPICCCCCWCNCCCPPNTDETLGNPPMAEEPDISPD